MSTLEHNTWLLKLLNHYAHAQTKQLVYGTTIIVGLDKNFDLFEDNIFAIIYITLWNSEVLYIHWIVCWLWQQ